LAAASPSRAGERGALAGALGAVLIWGLIPVGTRYFVLKIDPLTFNVLRFAASGSAALPLVWYARPWRWPGRDLLWLVLAALLSVPGYNIPVALGAQSIPASEIGLLIASEPIFIIAFTVLIQRRRVGARVFAGAALALAGVVVTAGVFETRLGFHWRGALEVLAGAASWSLYTVIAGRLTLRYGTFGITGALLVVGSAALAAVSLPLMHAVSWPDASTIAAVASLGIASSLIAFLLWNFASASLAAERIGLYLYLIPIICLAGSSLILDEQVTRSIVVGGALTIAGVWIASRSAVAGAAEPASSQSVS
jgi:drug/metabolite transporter (DMT)-like permease